MDEKSKKTGEKEPEEADPEKDSGKEAQHDEPVPALAAKDSDEGEDGAGEPHKDEGDAQEDGQEEAKKAEVERAKAQANDELLKTRERMLRIAADFENFRKRSKKDLEDAQHKARVDILKEMLPVFDNLARAVEHGGSVQDIEPIIQGARMVTKQFEENLARFGLKRIESVGEVFDPSIHDAIAQEESDEAKPGTIIKEFLAGYMLGDKLLRAAMVVVAKAGPGGAEKKKEDEEENETDGGD
jgi:molecular chaperone GrpE